MTAKCEFCAGTGIEPGFECCVWCDSTGTKEGQSLFDPGKPGSDMTAKATFSHQNGRLHIHRIEYSEPKACAASIGGIHCQVLRADGSLFCGQHRYADSRESRAPLTNEGLAFMMQRDGKQQ